MASDEPIQINQQNPGINFELYYEAVAADEAYQLQLEQVYGKRAGDMRFTKEAHGHPNIKPAHDRFLEASAAWRREMNNFRVVA